MRETPISAGAGTQGGDAHLFLNFGVATEEVVRSDALIGNSVKAEGGVMVLILFSEDTMSCWPSSSREPDRLPNSRKVAHDLQIKLLKQLGTTNTRALQDLRCTQGSAANDDHLPRTNDSLLDLRSVGAVSSRDVRNTDSLVAFKDDTADLGVGTEVQVGLHVHDAVDVS